MKQKLKGAVRVAIAAGLALGLAGVAIGQSTGDPKPSSRSVPEPTAGQDIGDTVVATVNGSNIYLSDVQTALDSLPPQYRGAPMPMVFEALVNQLIDRRLAADAARQQKLDEQPQVKRRLEQVEEAVLHEAWLTEKVEPEISEEKLRERYQRDIGSKPGPVEVHARHILVKTETEAQEVVDQLRRGADFAELAKEKSTDGSAQQGGDLGYFRQEQMVPEFAQAAFALEEGQVSGPVQTQFGWHVIKAVDRRTLPVPSFEESADQLRNEVAGEVIADAAETLRESAEIQRFNPDGMPQVGPQPAAPGAPAADPAKQ